MEEIEWEGRTLKVQEDGSVVITLSREDNLEGAIRVYSEFTSSGGKPEDFGRWLSDELAKAREDRLKKELKYEQES